MLLYIILFFGWVVFYALHSLLAHQTTKELIKYIVPIFFRFYRLGFNLFSVIFLLALLWFQFSIPVINIVAEGLLLKIMGAIIFFVGLTILIIAFANFNKAVFIGIEQLDSTKSEQSVKGTNQLVKSGIYGYVRHPLYFGLIIMLAGIVIYFPNYATLLIVVISFIYLPIGVKLEEQKLIEEFESQYLQYRKEVKMLIPYIF